MAKREYRMVHRNGEYYAQWRWGWHTGWKWQRIPIRLKLMSHEDFVAANGPPKEGEKPNVQDA